MSDLPGVLREIADLAGEDAARRIGERLADRTIKMPSLRTLRRRLRDEAIRRAHRDGASVADLAARHSLTPRRIQQIVSKN